MSEITGFIRVKYFGTNKISEILKYYIIVTLKMLALNSVKRTALRTRKIRTYVMNEMKL